jgi:hypothetical protein
MAAACATFAEARAFAAKKVEYGTAVSAPAASRRTIV